MTRTLRTVLLSATALGALATAAAAAPSATAPSESAMHGMTGMHASGTMAMHGDVDVDAMHADCPGVTDASMAMMHDDADHDWRGHHRTPGGDR